MNYQQDEKELCIMDCVWSILIHWRRIIVCMVLSAILIGGLKYVKDIRTLQAVKESMESSKVTMKDIAMKIKQLPKEDKTSVETAVNLIDGLKTKNEYAEKAAAMRIDRYNVDRVVLQYYIKSDEHASELVHAYSDSCTSAQAAAEIVEASGDTLTPNDVTDMLTFRNGGNRLKSSVNAISAENANPVLCVTVRGIDKETAEKTAEAVKNILNRYTAQVEKIYGAHSLLLVNESYENGKDDDILSIQNTLYDNIYYMTDRINVIKKNALGDEAAGIVNDYMELVNEQKIEEDTEDVSEAEDSIGTASLSKKWVLLGAILGAMFACGLDFLHWISGGRLNSVNEMQRNFSLRILGVIDDRKRQKKSSKIDRWIYKLRNRNKKSLSAERTFQMLLSAIVISARKADICELYVTGTEIERENIQNLLRKLRQAAEQSGLKLIIGQNISIDADAFSKMTEVGNVIIVEESNVSIYQEIARELQICKEQGVNVLGSIIIEH